MLRAVFVRTLRPGVTYQQFKDRLQRLRAEHRHTRNNGHSARLGFGQHACLPFGVLKPLARGPPCSGCLFAWPR